MPTGQYDRDNRKASRGPFTAEEEARVEELYRSGEHSARDIAREMNSNPSKILKILKARDVPLNPSGPSELQRRNRARSYAAGKERRRREAEVRLAQEIAEARKRDRVDRATTRLEDVTAAGGAMMLEEARASVALDRDETHAVGDVAEQFDEITEQGMNDEPQAEIRWRPREGEHIAHAQDASARIHAAAELLGGVGFFSGQLPHGHLVWQPEGDTQRITLQPAEPAPPEEEQPNLEELQAEHAAELERVHAWSKDQWAGGVRHGYDQATNDIASLLKECIRHAVGNAAEGLSEFLEMLEDGEHFYRRPKDPKPWLNPRSWEER